MKDIAALFNPKLMKKYDLSGPRYTSYPTALEFNPDFEERQFRQAVLTSSSSDLSVYIHIPFCHSLCYYCGCNKIITRNNDKVEEYLKQLIQEIKYRAPLFSRFKVNQLHFGGGTPSELSIAQLERLIKILKSNLNFNNDAEMSLELDPRNKDVDYISGLASLGFNRLSIGVQDTTHEVQVAINRVQCTGNIARLMTRAKQVGIKSINLDLIYGLPMQTEQRFQRTLNETMVLQPERISLFNYAHMPQKFAAQRKIHDDCLPKADAKLALMQQAISRFTQDGYDMIGIDHFAKPEDELAVAQRQKRLGRNFQGYSTIKNCDLVGFGVSAISRIGNAYSQNQKGLKRYYSQLQQVHHPIERGIVLSHEDNLRGYIIQELMTNLYLNKRDVEELFEIQFDDFFKPEGQMLKQFAKDGLLVDSADSLEIKPQARLFLRVICMTFDAYLSSHVKQARFSRVI